MDIIEHYRNNLKTALNYKSSMTDAEIKIIDSINTIYQKNKGNSSFIKFIEEEYKKGNTSIEVIRNYKS